MALRHIRGGWDEMVKEERTGNAGSHSLTFSRKYHYHDGSYNKFTTIFTIYGNTPEELSERCHEIDHLLELRTEW